MNNEIKSKAICSRIEAMQKSDCPKCNQKAGYYCITKNGNQVQVPHIDRLKELLK